MKFFNNIYNDDEFMSVASSILNNEEFKKTKKVVHHGNTRYNHSVRVGYLSYKFSKLLGGDKDSVIRGGVLHDFFLERDDKNVLTETKMLIKHPIIAKENAINYFNVNEKEKNIIESHMFPISSVAPKYKEAWIVSFCDKIVSLFEGTTNVKMHVSLWGLLIFNILK